MLLYDINRVDVSVEGSRGKRKKQRPGTVTVALSSSGKNNYTPNFMEYLVRVDNGDWKVADGTFRWKLSRRETTSFVRVS